MTITIEKFTVNTKGFNDIIDITNKINTFAMRQNAKNSNVCISVIGSTAAITTMEYEPGLIRDLPEILEKIAPVNKDYFHDNKWHDGNGYAHLRASLIGNSINLPVENNHLLLGKWQQVILLDFDNKPRTRQIIVQFIT